MTSDQGAGLNDRAVKSIHTLTWFWSSFRVYRLQISPARRSGSEPGSVLSHRGFLHRKLKPEQNTWIKHVPVVMKGQNTQNHTWTTCLFCCFYSSLKWTCHANVMRYKFFYPVFGHIFSLLCYHIFGLLRSNKCTETAEQGHGLLAKLGVNRPSLFL